MKGEVPPQFANPSGGHELLDGEVAEDVEESVVGVAHEIVELIRGKEAEAAQLLDGRGLRSRTEGHFEPLGTAGGAGRAGRRPLGRLVLVGGRASSRFRSHRYEALPVDHHQVLGSSG